MASVKVAVRVRPINQREIDLESRCIIHMEEKKTRITNLKMPEQTSEGDVAREAFKIKDFTYDFSFWSFSKSDVHYASQEHVFKCLGVDVITNAYEGYNACVFAYGQTGSGKTYTMMGYQDDRGLIPRICEGLFSRMTDESTSYRVEVSYLEIYNEKVRDLLKYSNSSKVTHSLRVREHPKDGPYVQDLSKHIVNNYGDIEELMMRGNNNRTTASTNMNDTSSRSHAIFTLVFTQANFSKDMPSEMNSKVHLVDLAGSERADATGATGQRLKEGSSINKSLVTLGNVISLLAEKGGKSKTFIPYRDSTLTWLLKDSLGGNSKTVMVATISPADVNYGEILSTLRYANRAKDIINKPTVNEDPNVKLIRELRAEISRLKALLGGHIDGISTPKVQEKLHENEARVKVLTEEWAGKWTEAAHVLQQEQTLALRKEGFGVILDSELPHLIGIDDDIISTGIMLYHLKEGKTTIGRTDAQVQQDIVLAGLEVEQEHCVIVNNCGLVTLLPLEGALCTINGVNVQDETQLTQGAVILLGKTNIFRFNHPAEAAKMKEELKACNLSVSRTSLLSQSMTDLSIYKSHENLLTLGFDFEQIHREELEKLEEKRHQIEELEDRYRQGEEERLRKQQSLERELEEKSSELEHMQQEAEKIKREAEQAHIAVKEENAMWKRKSMDLEKQVLELEVERENNKARAVNSDSSSSGHVSREPSVDKDKGEISSQLEEELALLTESEIHYIEEAKSLKDKLSKELHQVIAEQFEKKEELRRKIEELNSEEERQQEQLEEARDSLSMKKEALEDERQKELQLIATEKENIAILRREIGVAQRKGVLEGIESSVRLGEREGEIRDRLKGIQVREGELPAVFSEKERALEEKKTSELAELDRRIQAVEEEDQKLEERERAHKQKTAMGQFESEAEREELKAQGVQIEREKKQLEGKLKLLMEEEEEMTRKLQNEAEQLEKEKQLLFEKLEKDKAELMEIRQLQLDVLEDEIEERSHGLEDREGKVQEEEGMLLDLEDQHQIFVGKLNDQQKELQKGRQSLQAELGLLGQEESQARRMFQERVEHIDNDMAEKLEGIQDERKRLLTMKEALAGQEGPPGSYPVNGESLVKTLNGLADTSDPVITLKVQELEEMERRVVEIRTELEDKKKKLEEERDSELDKIEFEKLKLQEMEHQERINNLVEQEVKRRLFEEKVQREKQWRIDRLKDKVEREKEIERLKKLHDRELRQLKAKYERSNGNAPQVMPSKSNPYVTVMSPGVPEIRIQNASNSSGGSTKTDNHISKATTVEVTIPTYRLSGHGADSHYEYEVKIVIGNETWTIYRRYSRFRDLHQRTKKKIPEVGALEFPPKKIFSRSEKVVSDRHRSLEHYLINFIEVCRQSPSSALQASKSPYVSKQFLCEVEPFFKKGIFETTKHGTT